MPHLLYEETGGTATLTFNRVDVHNAIDDEIMRGLSEQVERLASREDIRAVLLTGAGREAFCSGGDLKWLQTFDTREKGEAMSRRMQGILEGLSALPVPVICVMNGYALGGGTEIALACDLRVMEAHAYFHFKQARVGLMTAWGGCARLLRLVGHGRAMELLATCRKLSAEEALRIGLANAVVPSGQGREAGARMAEKIARAAPMSVRSLKKLLLEAEGRSRREAFDLEAALFGETWASEDHDEAIRAFFEKRPPDFKGR